MLYARAESFRITTSWLTMEGSMAVMACGSRIAVSVCPEVSPMA